MILKEVLKVDCIWFKYKLKLATYIMYSRKNKASF